MGSIRKDLPGEATATRSLIPGVERSRRGARNGLRNPQCLGCCWGPVFVGGVFVGAALAYPYYGYPAYAYPYDYPVYAEPAYQPQTQVAVSPSVQRDVCYSTGCYHLQGDGVSVPYSWVWVPAAPPGPPSQ